MGRPKKENFLMQQNAVTAVIACLAQKGEAALGVNQVTRELSIKTVAKWPNHLAFVKLETITVR